MTGFDHSLFARTPPEGFVVSICTIPICRRASASIGWPGRKKSDTRGIGTGAMALNELTLPAQQWLHEKFRDGGFPPPRVSFQSRSATLRLRTSLPLTCSLLCHETARAGRIGFHCDNAARFNEFGVASPSRCHLPTRNLPATGRASIHRDYQDDGQGHGRPELMSPVVPQAAENDVRSMSAIGVLSGLVLLAMSFVGRYPMQTLHVKTCF